MELPKPVTVADVAANVDQQLTFMTIVINGQQYPKPQPAKHGLLAKALSRDPFAVGQLTITAGRLQLADEHDQEFRSFGPTVITGVELGIYHSVTNDYGPIVKFKPRFTANLEVTTNAATYHILNNDLAVLPVLFNWAHEYQLPVQDPMQLQPIAATIDWSQVTETQVKQWAQGTKYAKRFQISGAKPRG
ncbi:hypothetical protein [Lactiplantibacillus daowaiensis]|uniref:Uncharacterized protein n=1 Tax=Lactiplantibacillus daowaiensis TaxID=2559918 RepID=A0ABW1S3C6_9LACO|nr:hypothetical protein [Lactiplantibacillus daowaiensis]